MIPLLSFNQITFLIPKASSSLSSLLLLLLFFFLSILSQSQSQSQSLSLTIEAEAMKVHPIPKRRNISIQYQAHQALLNHNKKLRRLPHVFSRVLELPFRSDADVLIQESRDCFRFVAEAADGFGDDIRAHTVEIHPGVTKIVVRESGAAAELALDELELDMWRFRLPETTRPELARAVFIDGELIVTVPKIEGAENAEGGGGGEVWGSGDGNGNNGGFRGGMGNRLVLVR